MQLADDIGLPTDEGIFGFKPFPELWVGRLAMVCTLPLCPSSNHIPAACPALPTRMNTVITMAA